MKKYIFLLITAFTFIVNAKAQLHCSQIPTTISTDWRRTDGGNYNGFNWTRNEYDDVNVAFGDPSEPDATSIRSPLKTLILPTK